LCYSKCKVLHLLFRSLFTMTNSNLTVVRNNSLNGEAYVQQKKFRRSDDIRSLSIPVTMTKENEINFSTTFANVSERSQLLSTIFHFFEDMEWLNMGMLQDGKIAHERVVSTQDPNIILKQGVPMPLMQGDLLDKYHDYLNFYVTSFDIQEISMALEIVKSDTKLFSPEATIRFYESVIQHGSPRPINNEYTAGKQMLLTLTRIKENDAWKPTWPMISLLPFQPKPYLKKKIEAKMLRQSENQKPESAIFELAK
jgi:hypothetical protein